MGGTRRAFGIGRHKRKIEKFKAKHPEGRKAFAKNKRNPRAMKSNNFFIRALWRKLSSVVWSGVPSVEAKRHKRHLKRLDHFKKKNELRTRETA
jgi:hypothetical protein